MIRFTEWTPDQPPLSGGLTECKNCISDVGSFKSFPSATVYSTALNNIPKGAWAGFGDDGAVRLYAGTKTKLYDVSTPTPFDLTPSGTTYDVPDDGWWEFAKFGSKIIATNGNDNPQAMGIGGAVMADLAGSPPRARHVATAKNFVVFANTYDTTDGPKPQRVWWSAIGNSESWPTPGSSAAAAAQSGYQDLNDSNGGWINAITGGDRLSIFLQRGIYQAQYVGGNIVWQFDQVDDNRGLVADRAIAQSGRRIFFLDRDGFFGFDGVNVSPIGGGKVDSYFWSNVNLNYLYLTHAATDPNNKLAIWMYVDTASGSTVTNRALIYNWETGKWTRVEITDHFLFNSLTRGYTLDGLDAISTDIDSFTESLDSRNWNANNAVISGFNTSYRLVDYTGAALAARIETQEQEIFPGRRSVVKGVRPVVNGGPTVTVNVGSRALQSDSASYSSNASVNTQTGWHNTRQEGRYHRFRIDTSGAFDHLVGFDVDAVQGGYR